MKADLEDQLAEEANPVDELLDNASQAERWDPVLGSEGERKPALYGDDEDDEDGRPQGASMVEAGVEAAEFDQMLQSDKADPEVDEEPGEDLLENEDLPAPLAKDDDPNLVSEADAERLDDEESASK